MCSEGFVLYLRDSNDNVLKQAGLDPRSFLLGQVRHKGEAIIGDARRADHLKVQESRHCYRVYQRMLGFEDTPALTSMARIPKVDAVAVACPECGVYYDSQASLQMHIKHRHPHLNQQARLAFRRDSHALHGLPICRFCQVRLHDWRSLEKHITEGACPRIKEMLARGLDEHSMLLAVEAAEHSQPPIAPTNAVPQAPLDAEITEALQVDIGMLSSSGTRLRVLANHCALCRQLIPDGSKIKIHWQRTHATEWRKASPIDPISQKN